MEERVSEPDRYRIKQDGMVVAQADTQAQIGHYAWIYAMDGPVVLEARINRKWRPFAAIASGEHEVKP